MVKLVDMPDLGSGAARRVGSSPIIRTKKASQSRSFFLCLFLNNIKLKIRQQSLFESIYGFQIDIVSPSETSNGSSKPLIRRYNSKTKR